MNRRLTSFSLIVLLGLTLTTAAQDTTDEEKQKLTPVEIKAGKVTLSPENTKIEFVGTHKGGQPNPRLGGFEKFNGEIEVAADGTVKSIAAEFETASIWTQIPNLTNHLKTADFFGVEDFPSAKFQSTKISKQDESVTVTGTLTLLGNAKEISFPAKATIDDNGLTLLSQFKLDRTIFGMDKMTERVEEVVSLTVAVGQKTQPQTAAPGQGARGGFDPAAFFKQQDKDSDGKLTGDEIPERMKGALEQFDTDKDGSISQKEFEARMSTRRGGRGSGR